MHSLWSCWTGRASSMRSIPRDVPIPEALSDQQWTYYEDDRSMTLESARAETRILCKVPRLLAELCTNIQRMLDFLFVPLAQMLTSLKRELIWPVTTHPPGATERSPPIFLFCHKSSTIGSTPWSPVWVLKSHISIVQLPHRQSLSSGK